MVHLNEHAQDKLPPKPDVALEQDFCENVMLNLSSRQWSNKEEAEHMRLVTEGILQRKVGSNYWTVTYAENAEAGLDGVVTHLSLFDEGGVRLQREGAMQMDIYFQKGRHFVSNMATLVGPIDVAIFTNEAEGQLGPEGGNISLSYAFSLKQREAFSTSLELEVCKKGKARATFDI